MLLSARTLSIQRLTFSTIRRGYATTATADVSTTAGGVKVASVDFGQPTSAVTVLVKKAGSRFQGQEGLGNALKNFAFKSTGKRSAIGTVREAELYGGLLSASLGREQLALTAEFLRGDEAFFVDVLSSFLTSARFTRHEYEEYVQPLISFDTRTASSDSLTRSLEAAHAIAFRSGLGSSLFAPDHPHFGVDDIKVFAQRAFVKDNVAVVGTNIEASTLNKLVDTSFAGVSGASAVDETSASRYFGGETRLEAAYGGLQTVFVGFGTTNVSASAELATLAAHLSTTSSVKWARGLSPIVQAIPEGTSVQSLYLPYSDAGLFGLVVSGRTVEGVKEAGKVAVEVLKNSTKGLTEDELKSALAKAKFGAASAVESREGLIRDLGAKIFTGDMSVESTLSALDKVTMSSFSQVVSSLVSAKPTFVAVGDSLKLPYADELGL